MKRKMSAKRLLRTRSAFQKSVVVSVGVPTIGNIELELTFIEPGAKTNGVYYRDVLLGQNLLPAVGSVNGEISHSSRTVFRLTERAIQWSICLNVYLVSSHRYLWPHNSPDLNPIDYEVLACCGEESIPYHDQVSTTLSSVLLKSGVASTTGELFDSSGVFMLVC